MLCASDTLPLASGSSRGAMWLSARRHLAQATVLVFALAWLASAHAQSAVDIPVTKQVEATDGRFLIVQANTQVTSDVLLLDAEVVYGLTPGPVEALNSGVPLLFETQIELDRSRRFLPDPNVVKLIQRSQLTYHALTQRFIVRSFNSSEQTSHVTLSDALKQLGQLQDLPIIDISLLDPNATYSMRMRSVLDTRSYAAPLRMLAALFQVDDWRIESPWERWLVTL